MAKPWENYNAKKAAQKAAEKEKADKRARNKEVVNRQFPLPMPDPYPQHAKLYPHTTTNWEIREFWHFLAEQGLSPLSWEEMNDQLLKWRGVDKGAYEAEAADMRVKYKWLWEQYEPRLPEIASLIDETKAPKLGGPGSHLPELKVPAPEPEITKNDEMPVSDPAQALMDRLRGSR